MLTKIGAQHADVRVFRSERAGYRVPVNSITAPKWPDDPALFLDLDGTLLDFAPEPAAVHVPARLRAILAELSSITDGAVAFVSGRTLADLDRLLGAGRFPLAAVHGIERRDAEGRLSREATDVAALDRMHAALENVMKHYPLAFLEHKRVALAIHYRRCPEVEQQLVEAVERRLEGIGSELKLMRGNKVLEIKPGSGNKGTAISAFMKEPPFSGRTPVFVGDDVTDEDGFRVVNELGGVSVKVDAGPSCASFRLPDTKAVLDWIDQLLARGRT